MQIFHFPIHIFQYFHKCGLLCETGKVIPLCSFCLRGPRYGTKMSRQKWLRKAVTVFNSSILTSFVTAGVLCFPPTNSQHPLVNPLDYTHSGLVFMHVSEGEITSFGKKQLKVRRDFMNCFLPLLFHWSAPAYPRDLLPVLQNCIKVGYEEQCPPFEVLCFPCLWNSGEFPDDWQRISKWSSAQACSVPAIQPNSSHWHLRCSVKFRGPCCALFAGGFWKVSGKALPWCTEIQQPFKDWG